MNIKHILVTGIIGAFALSMNARDIQLPQPVKNGGMELNQALANRQSSRSFDPSIDIPEQVLSNILWSACGINREDGRLTSPTALNKQEIDVYVFTKKGIYLYDRKNNKLLMKVEGDYRGLVAGNKDFKQEYVLDAPISLVIVGNVNKFGEPNERNSMMAAVDAGIVCQNINLACVSNGIATVPRASMDTAGIGELLKFPKGTIALMNNPIGYNK